MAKYKNLHGDTNSKQGQARRTRSAFQRNQLKDEIQAAKPFQKTYKSKITGK